MASIDNFKELMKVIPHHYRLNLLKGEIKIMPVHSKTSMLFLKCQQKLYCHIERIKNIGEKEVKLITQIGNWCSNNRNLVGRVGSSQVCSTNYRVNFFFSCANIILIAGWLYVAVSSSNGFMPRCLCRSQYKVFEYHADIHVFTICKLFYYWRWNTLPPNEQEEVFPALAPNFVAEIRSMSDSESSVHEKMCTWIEAGVEESDHYLLVMFIDYCY